MSTLIQPLVINVEQKIFQLNYEKTINEMRLPRINCTLGLIKEDMLLCFGGVEECQHFLNIEGFNLKINEK